MPREEQTPMTTDDDQPPGVPSWLKYLLAALVAVALLAVLVMVVAGGDHGPGRHSGGQNSAPADAVATAGTGR